MPRSPFAAKLVRRRTNKPGDLAHVRKMLWQALVEAEAVLLAAEDPELVLKAAHCISQCAGQYTKLIEDSEIVQRLAALEGAMQGHAA